VIEGRGIITEAIAHSHVQVGNQEYVGRGVIRGLAHIYREEGAVGLFRGNGTNVLRMVPYSAVQFAVYERVKEVCCVPADGLVSTYYPNTIMNSGVCATALLIVQDLIISSDSTVSTSTIAVVPCRSYSRFGSHEYVSCFC
jgi:solute carrier family 25 phosphate transporter 23/24/25/41